MSRTEACGFHNRGNHALHYLEQSHHQLQAVSHRTFGKCEADKKLQCVFGLLDLCEVAAGTHHAHDKEQHEQGKPYRLQCTVDVNNDFPYRTAFEILWGLGNELPYLG